ncbi:hypothetical protein A2Y85_01455 [candidate division WOR-3 bacterium RBG_13_43_14]|uniref:ABC transporter domain-containing protein n=1 Tax=candidate division WOR-3 bacterium RBG_13_43_14 TaxID=1802590 RepID=A0A1F4U8Q4_UNCW3|nr:MAG: hypothetical protein A2Y85_01455 [candidate division WOR-3 bacterium RBG_13_43_14]
MSNILELKCINKVYYLKHETVGVLQELDLKVRTGEFLGIYGPSGCGKSTLLNVIGGLDQPTSGEVYLDGINLLNYRDLELSSIRNTKIGFIFQFHHLLTEFTCLENIMLPGLINGQNHKRVYDKAQELLEKLGIGGKKDRLPDEISGGERQRVAVARALINEPLLILADEPTGNLDDENTSKLMEIFAGLNREGRTIVLVTHSLDFKRVCTINYQLREGQLYGM